MCASLNRTRCAYRCAQAFKLTRMPVNYFQMGGRDSKVLFTRPQPVQNILSWGCGMASKLGCFRGCDGSNRHSFDGVPI